MLHSLIWAIWALSTSPSAAERPARLVKWEDLMVATSAFPRFSGEVANITRTGTPKVAAVLFNSGAIEPITCRSNAEGLHCDADCGDCGDVAAEFPNAINELQLHSPPQLDGLTFIGNRILSDKKEDGTKCRSFFLWQSNPAGKIPIDNTVVQINLNENTDGSLWLGPEPNRYEIYNGEFDEGSPTPSCNQHRARDTAAHAALKQPFWDALYPAGEYKLVYTVQDGRLFLTWRITFDLTDEVGDDFRVWVDARNCTQIVAAAPAEMDSFTHSLDDFITQQVQLFEDRGIAIRRDPAEPSKIIL